MKRLALDEAMFQGAISLERGDGWIRPWRLPFHLLSLFPDPEGIVLRAGQSAGVRLRLATNSRELGLEVQPFEERRLFDLTVDNELLDTTELPAGAGELRFEPLAEGEKVVEVWLPADWQARPRALLLDDGAWAAPAADDRRRWVAYGSSITHCRGAHSPARTWPATAARMRDLHLTSLGFGGQCHLDPMVALTIRDLPADLISIKAGINIYGAASLSPRTFQPALIGFVRIVREGHPNVPIIVVSPIISPPREAFENAVGYHLAAMRDAVADSVQRLADLGDEHLHYVDGRELFGPDLVAEYLPDELHPNGDGYEILGRNFAEKVLTTVDF